MDAFFQGFVLTISIIIAVGLQNTYVLRQGILGRHVFAAALTCILSDYVLIILGSMGLGSFLASDERLRMAATVGGILFLLYFGIHSWVRAYQGKESSAAKDGDEDVASLKRTILMALAFSFLNPLTLMETTIIVGGYSVKFPDIYDRSLYTVGSMAAATVWFFSLAYAAKILRPWFLKPSSGRILDVIVGILMFLIAAFLIVSEFIL
jgi:L-lysine exporter family protein LysE/ArgO